MIIEISVAIAVLIFAILAFYIIRTLLILQVTLKRLDHMMWDIHLKVKNLEPFLKTLSQLGEVSEAKSEQLNRAYFESQEHPKSRSEVSDWAEWLMLSLKIGSKFFKGR